ncbi:YhcN/YlaJ family sporulation lipoprotein [Cohnella suwonensis]|uniref:YhcN/YlaJ family sporulation lipoprotein n=1 Tax=Cohnella suwonensis TaxID=696072 RepID=A0ABW0LVJ3_9BACL
MKAKRAGSMMTCMLIGLTIALSGCMEKTGDLGNKNIRPNAVGNGKQMRFANDQDNERNRIDGNQRINNNIVGMHGNSNLQLGEKVAAKIAKMPGIDSAYVMITENNAYVAVKEKAGGTTKTNSVNATQARKDKIADLVKASSPTVENVYVSANPEFESRMAGYAADVRMGHPLQGFLSEFNALVERVFPAASGSRDR